MSLHIGGNAPDITNTTLGREELRIAMKAEVYEYSIKMPKYSIGLHNPDNDIQS